jgi:hypothetical protein
MGNGQWAMGNRQWAMGNGQWAMGNGQWAMGEKSLILRGICRFPLVLADLAVAKNRQQLLKSGSLS